MKKQRILFISVTIFIISALGISLLFFGSTLSQHIHKDVEMRLQDNLEPNVISFNMQMQEQIKKVNTFADFLGNNWELGKEVHTSLLQSAVANNGLLRCAIAYPDGSFITHDSKNDGNVSNDEFFIANMEGRFFITDPRPAVVDPAKRVILFSTPIKDKEEKIVGSVIYSYLCDDMDQIFNLKSMGGDMNMVITKADGQVLIGSTEISTEGESLFDNLRGRCTHKQHPEEDCLSLKESSGTYFHTFAKNEGNRYVRYDKLPYNDWYLISSISETAANSAISFAVNNQRTLSVLIAAAIIVYLIFILMFWLFQRKLVDPDTGALTLYAFKRKAKKIFKRRTSDLFVVVKLDVKDFKLINRIYSFSMGDKLIRSMAQALNFVLEGGETAVARLGSDVFVLLLPYRDADTLDQKRHAFIHRVEALMDEEFTTKIVFPTGQYVLQPSDYPKPDIDEILEKVNFAHRAAKQNTDVIIDYVSDIESSALFEKSVEDRMENAIRDREFTLYLQPKILLKDESICGAEALVRWEINGKYYMYPTDFIPVLEKNGFIVQLDKYMFDRAARFQRECLDNGITPIPISVNFSRHHLNNTNFVDELCQIADKNNVPRKYLEIELTESTFLGDIDNITALIDRLHYEGFSISMDDFGSGYSCFAQLKDLKIDILKIDKGFFAHSEDASRAEVVIAGILKIAQQLEITTVAEGIEKKEQVDMLRSLGCDIVQGFYYSRPVPSKELDIANFKVDAHSY